MSPLDVTNKCPNSLCLVCFCFTLIGSSLVGVRLLEYNGNKQFAFCLLTYISIGRIF